MRLHFTCKTMLTITYHIVLTFLLHDLQFSHSDASFRDFQTGNNVTEDLSKNISSLLEKLLKHYDSSQRPKSPNDEPIKVNTSMLVRSMGPISEMRMTYQMDCYFRQSWTDSRLQFEGPVNQLNLSIKMLDGIWKPDTFFHNGHKSYIHTVTVPNKLLRIKKNGEVFYSVRLTIKASCPMQLHKFPMDVQSCPLILGSFAYSKQDVIFVWGRVVLDESMVLSQFDLIGEPQLRNFNLSISQKGVEFSMLQVNFTLQRHMGYFLLQIYFPCILIVVLSWVSFWINREATADRIGLGITTVLTLSTFVLDTRNDLPKVHYPTALDWFVFMCFTFVIATLLEFAGVHYFTKIGSGEIIEDIDKIWEDVNSDEDEGLISLSNEDISSSITELQRSDETESHAMTVEDEMLSTVTTTRSVGIQTHHDFSFWKQFSLCLTADEDFKQRNQVRRSRNKTGIMNSVSKIDRISRILFPLVFSLLNLIYWLVYTQQTKIY